MVRSYALSDDGANELWETGRDIPGPDLVRRAATFR